MQPGTFAATTPEKPAVVMADGPSLTYAELEARSNQVARLFRAAGLVPGDHIAFVLENRVELFVITWAAQRSGLYYTACSTRLTPDELAHIVDDCGARVLIASATTAASAGAITAQTPRVELRLLVDGSADGFESLGAAVADLPTTPIADQAEGADMLYSSGTTGRPKGVLTALPSGEFPTMSSVGGLCLLLFGAAQDSVYLSPAPLYHAAPLRFCMAMHRLGATVIVQEHFDPVAYLELVEQHRVTMSQVVPTMFIRMLKLPDEVRADRDLSSLHAVVHAAAPCPVAVKEQMIAWWGPVIHEYYAGTEGNGFVYCNSADWLAHKGTVGRAIVGALHIVGDDGIEVPIGETGTVYFEGGSNFSYHNDPEKTAGSRDPLGRGWSTLGDVGNLDDEGFLYLTDRKAYMIISGGVNIYPQEAENVLALHPKVDDVAVFGVPDDEMGERVHAVVQPRSMGEAGPALAVELMAFCREQLAGLKCPRTVDFRAELPRHPTGKLYKRLLKDEYWRAAGRSI
ncbi:MAG: AMP-binding protein [Acidimicrobiales bacterium]